jgi:hypothetical protein
MDIFEEIEQLAMGRVSWATRKMLRHPKKAWLSIAVAAYLAGVATVVVML